MSISRPTDAEVAIITMALRMFPDSPLDGGVDDFDYSHNKQLAMKLHKDYLALHKKREKERLAREYSVSFETGEKLPEILVVNSKLERDPSVQGGFQ